MVVLSWTPLDTVIVPLTIVTVGVLAVVVKRGSDVAMGVLPRRMVVISVVVPLEIVRVT